MATPTNNNILAVDIGFRSTGLALFEITKDGYTLKYVRCCSPKQRKKTKHDYVAVMDAQQVMQMASEIILFIRINNVERMIVELPSGGAKSSRAVRLMGMASAMIATISTFFDIPIEFFTPREIKMAAVGKPKAEKDEIMDAMSKLFPILVGIPKCRKEHIADACACMIAAKDGTMVRNIREAL